ncbi:hypothetical protein EB233_14735 [Mesorhizobium erdmanii]|uniref:Uncharacterized protein n=1 Tax=Mesorhizobium erdmanii TaxID=1777866 RepID=A0A6M7UKH2_9HYPH|nr:hypothetical protein A8146_26150 [Mesorhizobium loti]QKC76618.1 hypothetical protein EB233_14735 [Mesorhizobium erdmanii]
MRYRLVLQRWRRPSLPCRAFLPVNGAKEAGRNADAIFAALVIGEIIDEGGPRPVYGERMPAGR